MKRWSLRLTFVRRFLGPLVLLVDWLGRANTQAEGRS